jgi:CHAT domain-containing protein
MREVFRVCFLFFLTCLYQVSGICQHKEIIPKEKIKEHTALIEKELFKLKENNGSSDSVLTIQNEKDLYIQFKNQMLLKSGAKEYEEAVAIGLSCELAFSDHLNIEEKAALFYNIGTSMDKMEAYQDALIYYKKAIDIYESIEDLSDSELVNNLAMAYNNIGVIHAYTGFFTKRKEAYLRAKKLWEGQSQVNAANLLSLYGNLIRLYRQYWDKTSAGELINSINHNFKIWFDSGAFESTDSEFENSKPLNFYLVEKHRLNILYTDLTDDKKAGISHLDSLMIYFNKMDQADQENYSDYLLNAISSAAAPLVNYDDPNEKFLKKQYLDLGMNESIRLKNRYNQMIFHTQLVSFYLNSADDYDKALVHLDHALEIGRRMDIREFNLLNIFFKKGDVLQKSNRFDQAEKIVYQGFSVLMGDSINNLMEVDLEAFKEKNDIYYINALMEVAKIYKNEFEKEGNLKHARISFHYYNIAANIFNVYYQKGIYNPWLDQTNKEISEGLVMMHMALGKENHGSLLNTIENNTSQHLWKEFEAKYQHYSPVSDSLFLMKSQLSLLADSEFRNDSINSLLEKVQNEIISNNPSFEAFFENRFELANFQKVLSPEIVVLNYTVTASEVFLFLITKDEVSLRSLGRKEEVLKKTLEYYNTLRYIHKDFGDLSKELYSLLIPESLNLDRKVNQIVVLPEDLLNLIPFESLTNPKTNALLLKDYNVSYSYSLRLWQLQQVQLKNPNHKGILAVFSPEYDDEVYLDANTNAIRLGAIEGARLESEFIAGRLKGDIYSKAIKSDFLENSQNYSIYHFAMHAKIDETDHSNSALIFQNNESLYYEELYGMEFPADLVVLSACNTGVGKLEKGEGLMSISRALTYSGVRSSVYSLWQVPDSETAEIIMEFYKNLENGMQKSDALAQAKRDFILNNPLRSHPYFWAGFVLNGHTGNLPTSNSFSIPSIVYWILISALLALLSIWFLKSFKRH